MLIVYNGDPGDELPETSSNYQRRFRRLSRMGFDELTAHQLAESPVPIADVRCLLERGCPLHVAAQIVL